jgi:hypothetical protein|tara:strand:- start:66 stop:407 length:342 start_codon:yes stop_codon:yes gene_type:complete
VSNEQKLGSPSYLENCREFLMSLEDSQIKEFKELPEHDVMVATHFGLGMALRNNFINVFSDEERTAAITELEREGYSQRSRAFIREGDSKLSKHPDDISAFTVVYLHGWVQTR